MHIPDSHQTELMTLAEYDQAAAETAIYPDANSPQGLLYSALGMNGEAGEVAELVKKMVRDDGGWLTPGRREKLLAELGDVLWYVSAAARDAGWTLEQVARHNVEKLRRRKREGTLQGSGSGR